jgi:hypothetical protein
MRRSRRDEFENRKVYEGEVENVCKKYKAADCSVRSFGNEWSADCVWTGH